MDVETIRIFCLSQPFVYEYFPFDNATLAFKVDTKIFAFMHIDAPEFINLKCDPDQAITLREAFVGIKPGYHMNKKHWNSVYLQSDVSDALIKELIKKSYKIVYQSLTKKVKNELKVG